ncbi:MAG: hypothetical protein K9G33_13965 [Sneathiella sp.]|nr:hypothetical protein [Sneathiella sp.]
MSDPILIVEGRLAASWLAGQSYRIGLDAPARYPQSGSDEIVKLNSEVCLVTGLKVSENILHEWEARMPDGLTLHKLDRNQKRVVSDISRRCP